MMVCLCVCCRKEHMRESARVDERFFIFTVFPAPFSPTMIVTGL
jgi:hypothetical protein